MSMKSFHEIEAKTFEDVRKAMIAYHKEQQERFEQATGRLQRDKWENRAKAGVHEGMIDFWTDAVFKPVKRRKRNYTGIS